MGISAIYKGNQPLMHNIVEMDNGEPFVMTGINTSDITFNLVGPGGHRTGTGIVTLTDAAHGLFDYQWSSGDSAYAGKHTAWFDINMPTGPISLDPQTIYIIDLTQL